jgi:hypothetical protein
MAATPLAVASGCRQQPTDRSVRLGSFSDLGARSCEVRFTLKTRHRQPSLSGPKSATTGLMHRSSIQRASMRHKLTGKAIYLCDIVFRQQFEQAFSD